MLQDVAILVDFYSYEKEYQKHGWDIRFDDDECFEYYVREINSLKDVDDDKLEDYLDDLRYIGPSGANSGAGVHTIISVDFIIKGEAYSGIKYNKDDIKDALKKELK